MLKIKRIDHVAIAVNDIEEAKARWQEAFGLVSREQELNRLQKQLTAQEETLKQREASVAAVTSELHELEARAAQLRPEVAAQEALAESKRAEAEQLGLAAASARVVGTPRADMASLTMYSRRTGPRADLPSPPRENRVRPDPFSCRS